MITSFKFNNCFAFDKPVEMNLRADMRTKKFNSNVFNISVYFNGAEKAGTKLEIKNSNNDVVISHTSAKKFTHASIGTENFELGKKYYIYINDKFYQEFTISDITTVLGSSNYNMNKLPARR